MARRPRCAYCKKAFTPKKRGRPPKYCCAAHRQAQYVMWPPEQARRMALLGTRDLEYFRTREGIKRAVISVLREIGILPPEPKQNKPTPFRLVKGDDSKR
jgi:hypothetical protein